MSALDDANSAANLFKAEGNLERYQNCLDLIKEIWQTSANRIKKEKDN